MKCQWADWRVCPTPEIMEIKDIDERDAECMWCSLNEIISRPIEKEGEK
jgi:hypothetical protein